MEETKKVGFFEKVGNGIKETGKKIGDGLRATGQWIKDNPLTAMTIAGCAASASTKAYKSYRLHADEVKRRRTFYDPRRGRYSEAKRDLRPWELDEIDSRYSAGESYSHILMDMNLLR